VIEHMCEAVEKYGGTVSQVMGDGILALFGAPVSWEDHAVRAVLRGAQHAGCRPPLWRRHSARLRRAVQIRIGLNSGEVVLNVSGRGLYMSYIAVGRTVHIAARMEQMAKPGSVLATAETVRLAEGYVEARSIGPVSVKGIDQPVEVAEISRASTPRSRFDRAPVRAMTPFLGRERELAKLLEVFDDVALRREGRIASSSARPASESRGSSIEFLRIVLRKDALALDGGGAPYAAASDIGPACTSCASTSTSRTSRTSRRCRRKVAGGILALDGDANRSRRSHPRADARASAQSPVLRPDGSPSGASACSPR
jgi:hypothetical protein